MNISATEALDTINTGEGDCTWGIGRASHLGRIFNVFDAVEGISGPSLDIGSGRGSFFRLLNRYRPDLLHYSCADLDGQDIAMDGTTITVHKFECDRDRLPIDSQSMGLVFLCDVLEHLIVDPVWTLLEINRVLRVGGHFVLSTPNVSGIDRVLTLLGGFHPGTEHHYKPSGIYDRHNREWTPSEVILCTQGLGFKLLSWSSNIDAVPEESMVLIKKFRELGLTPLHDVFFGPDLVFVFEKVEHLTLDDDLPDNRRWPAYLYTGYPHYRCRPKKFPIEVSS